MKQVPVVNYASVFKGKKEMVSIPDNTEYQPAKRKVVGEYPKMESGVVCRDEDQVKAAKVQAKEREKAREEAKELKALEEQDKLDTQARLAAQAMAQAAVNAQKEFS